MATGAIYSEIHEKHRLGIILIFLFIIIAVFLGTSEASPDERILSLTSEGDHYFLGPYLAYLKDPDRKLTIDEASSPQMAARYVRHSNKMLNLGLNSYAYWIRFTVQPSEKQVPDYRWLLHLGWPHSFDYATLYIPEYTGSGWSIREVGRKQPPDSNPLASAPAVFLPPLDLPKPITIYLRVESSDTKQLALQILTEKAYNSLSRSRSLWFGVYYGIILAMFLYNLILLFSLRELNRLYYLIYLFFLGLLFLTTNGLLDDLIETDVRINRILVLVFICLTFFWGNLFAKSFLITKKHAPVFDKLLSVAMILALVLLAMLPFFKLTWMTFAISIQSVIVPPIFLLAAVTVLKHGFRPARFFLIAFATLALSTMLEALVVFEIVPYLGWTRYSSQFGSSIEVILLQLALADRIKTLSREQEQIRQSLFLAREVQQNLLPRKCPQFSKLDIAGKSIYCDETGGDYYDFIMDETVEDGAIGIAVGDVSGHGISSALLMATVRSSLRQRSSLPGSVAGIISDVNRQLVRDVEDSGQFMTMFYMSINPTERTLKWVRAGHDPAIFYDPQTDTFEDLAGPGVALGVVEDWEFEENTLKLLNSVPIIFLSTDGIWEACNDRGEMFGKMRIYELIRNHSSLGAEEILDTILAALDEFLKGAKLEDDITIVVVKFQD